MEEWVHPENQQPLLQPVVAIGKVHCALVHADKAVLRTLDSLTFNDSQIQ